MAEQAVFTSSGGAEDKARLHTMLRFAIGTAAAFVISEAMGWYPSFFPALLAGALLANLPAALPAKAGIALIIVQAAGAYAAYALATLLHGSPVIQFALIGVVLFIGFAALARGQGLLPILLVLISFAAIPVVTMVIPQQAGALPLAFARSMIIAVISVWVVHELWPAVGPPRPPEPKLQFASPVAIAAIGTAIVLPLMLVFMLYGITDAFPLLITTIVLVINFDPARGAIQGAAMMLGNFIGGMTAVIAYGLLQIDPNLLTLGLIVFLIALVYAERVARGGAAGAVGLVTFNQAMVIFSLALLPGGASSGLWLTRLSQFGAAGLFAVGMMTLLLPSDPPRRQLADEN